jgi:hypothetical protein
MHLSRSFAAVLAAVWLILPFSACAQSGDVLNDVQAEPPVQAVISGPSDIAIGRTIVLDAALTRSTARNLSYRWYVAGRPQPISDTVEAVYTPDQAGTLIFRLVVRIEEGPDAGFESTVVHMVTVYSRKITLIADGSVPGDKIAAQQQAAAEAGLYLQVLHASGTTVPLIGEDVLASYLAERADVLAGAETTVLWTTGVSGLQALTEAVSGKPDLQAGLRNQTIVLITDGSIKTLSRIALGPFSQLQPQSIVVTRSEALSALFGAASIDEFYTQLEDRDVAHLRIDDSSITVRPWNLFSSLVNVMLSKGIPSQTVILLLVLPVIALILTFLKQVIGITTIGLYLPSIIALSFLALGWPLGILFLLFIIIAGYAARALLRPFRLLYIPKVAIVLTVVSIILLLLMGVSAFIGITFSRETIFILLIMSTLSESFLNIKTEQGLTNALMGVGETVLASLICVFIVQWNVFQSMILAYPELILLTVIANIALGRWTGLRLMEYVRFREVLRHMQEE